ncbi:MAG: hypothetical protein K6F20_07120 [Bacteroidaceae bacterium]|nr:hypothetical protein [Bacteroidaceae bacterium]
MKKRLLQMCLSAVFLLTTTSVRAQNQKTFPISTAQDLADFAAMVNGGDTKACAALMDDIDYTSQTARIGTDVNFEGTLDGKGHSVTVNFTSETNGIALVHNNYGTVKDLCVKGTLATSNKAAGGIVAFNHGVVERCVSLVTIEASVNGDGTHGGIAGQSYDNSRITDCIFAGKIVGENTTNCGGIVGWLSGVTNIENCLAIGEVNINMNTSSNAIARNSGAKGKLKNNYFLRPDDYKGTADGTALTAAQLESGEACFLLNGSKNGAGSWFQKLGAEAYPTPLGKDVVYGVGTMNCDGSLAEGFTYSNTDDGFTATPHNLGATGICSVCGKPDTAEDGFYLIPTAEALRWVAEQVNGGNRKMDIRLTADLDLGGENWIPIGNDNQKFVGNVDGGRHTISNMTVDWDQPGAGLFGTVEQGDFYDLLIDASCSVTGIKYSGALIGHSYGGFQVNLTNIGTMCDVTCNGEAAAGLIGNANSGSICNITRCFTTGKISAEKDAAAFSGWEGNVGAVIRDSWSVCDITGFQDANHYLARYGGLKIENCYCHIETSQGALIADYDESMIPTGELCYKLNGQNSDEEIIWYQTLGEDATPVPWTDHRRVFANGALRCDGTSQGGALVYSNTQESVIPPHQYDHGLCTVCGGFQADYKTLVDGAYELGDAKDILWFAQLVENGNSKANARLTADIDMSEVMEDFKPIGWKSGANYGGTFDGGFHTISGFVLNSPDKDAGFIGTAVGGMTLKNIVFDASCSISSDAAYAGLVGGSLSGDTGTITFLNVGNEGNVTTVAENAGGIMGCNHGSSATYVFENCYTTGVITGGKESGAISGWTGTPAATLNNCWTTAEVTGYQSEERYLIRYGSNAPKMKNVFATKGNQGEIIEENEIASGELCFKLNGEDILDASWYQTLGEDMHPVWNNTHGLVYPYDDESFADVHDQASYLTFRSVFISNELEDLNIIAAWKQVIEAYREQLSTLEDQPTLPDFLTAFAQIKEAREAVINSALAYAQYILACEEAIMYLEENEFGGEPRAFLETYLEDHQEPGEYPNGTYPYILEAMQLDNEQIAEEASYVNALLQNAVASDYKPGSEITTLLTNASLTDGFNGWTWEKQGSTFTTGGAEGFTPSAEAWNCTFDMQQTLTGLKDGIYMLTANAAFRPGANVTGQRYSAQLYLNDNINFVMTEGEDAISKEDAVDGLNCHISGDATDYSYVFGDMEGWVPQGPLGCSYAFNVGRYQNYVVVEVKDGTLTVGLKSPGTGMERDWTGFGNFRLFYLGNKEEAAEALVSVLYSYMQRTQWILNQFVSSEDDYEQYPNIPAALRQELETIFLADLNPTGEGYLNLINHYSDLFKQVYEAQKAYADLIGTARSVLDIAGMLTDNNLLSMDELFALNTKVEEATAAYDEGAYSIEEAKAATEALKVNDAFPPVEGGYYMISTPKQMGIFAMMVNAGSRNLNAKLVNDIDFEGETVIPIGWNMSDDNAAVNDTYLYAGIFDGQGHHIRNMVIDKPTSIGVGLFGTLTSPAEIKNLVLESSCAITGKDRAGLIGRSTAGGVVTLTCLGNEGTVTASQAAAGIMGNANNGSIAYITDCYSTGEIKQAEGIATGKDCSLICGWLGNVGAQITNCWSISEISGYQSQERMFCRLGGSVTFTNCWSLRGDGSQAHLASEADFASGKVTYALNNSNPDALNGGNTGEPVWYQTLGEDQHPVFDSSHSIVVKNEDGSYGNITAISTPLAEGRQTEDVYSISGLKVGTSADLPRLPKGIYIRGGKKYLVK